MLSNSQAGTNTTVVLPYPGPAGGTGAYTVAVPAGTVAGHTLTVSVEVSGGLGSYITFNCTTGAVLASGPFPNTIAIPTLSQWGLLAMVALILAAAAAVLQRRRAF